MTGKEILTLDAILTIIIEWTISTVALSGFVVYAIITGSLLLVVVAVLCMQALNGITLGLVYRLAKQVPMAEGEETAEPELAEQ